MGGGGANNLVTRRKENVAFSNCNRSIKRERENNEFFNAGSDKRQYYRAALSVSSDAVPQFRNIFNIELENWLV